MRFTIIIFFILSTFIGNLAHGASNSAFCKKLKLIAITRHYKENFDFGQ